VARSPAAWVLNCQPHDVPTLVAAHRLKPLGNPPANSIKYFATLELLEQVKDRTRFDKVTQRETSIDKGRIRSRKTG
jgi:hypothetical protein